MPTSTTRATSRSSRTASLVSRVAQSFSGRSLSLTGRRALPLCPQFNNMGTAFNVSEILDDNKQLDYEKYTNYSQP